jgi:RimJ/RimL family protein N-acetyltransferase
MHPGLVGQGHGSGFVAAILAFAREAFAPQRFRVTIAAFNERSQRTFRKLGFRETSRFTRDGDGLEFIQLERRAGYSSE